MPNINISPNMNLPIPVIGVDPGPDWAINVNASLTLIDQHTHASGSGIQVTPAGLNINSDLAINGNNLTLVRTTRFQSQVSVIPASSPDLECLYVSGVDLYYNDGSGNQVRMTQGGVVTGAAGSITGLVSPASASYNSGSDTFIWQSASSTPANMDFGSAIFRNITANSNGITISPPNALGSNYTLTLPTLPSVQSFMTLDNSGNIAAPWTVDNSTLAISGSNVIVKTAGITTTQIANATILGSNIANQTLTQGLLALRTTGTTVAAGGVAISGSCGVFTTTSNTFIDVTNLSVTLTTTGRPVQLFLQPDNSGSSNSFGMVAVGNAGVVARILNGVTELGVYIFNVQTSSGNNIISMDLNLLDFPSAGTYTYSVQLKSSNGGLQFAKLIAYEI